MKKYLTNDQIKIKIFEKDYDLVILNFIDFANYMADKYARRSVTHDQDDIRGVAILAMCEGVHELLGHPNPRGYLHMKIKGAVINFCVRDHTIHRPQGTERAEKWQYIEDIPTEESELTMPKETWAPFDPKHEAVKARIFDSIFLSKIEKEILCLKVEGHTIQEIEILCERPYAQVQRILQGTKTRVENLLAEKY